MKNIQTATLVGFILSAYVILKALTEKDEIQGQFLSAVAIFLMLFVVKNLQKA